MLMRVVVVEVMLNQAATGHKVKGIKLPGQGRMALPLALPLPCAYAYDHDHDQAPTGQGMATSSTWQFNSPKTPLGPSYKTVRKHTHKATKSRYVKKSFFG